ncbi:unnamed protein product [Schistosoma margrebowiei]|uniref:Uncharacterized protein n=1 Tax=Schistosoma margrebowiei TaxID=48269 RepID=A0A183NBS2_9TREM|nr:unnamed protein product [Schistosoma margrebowiei]
MVVGGSQHETLDPGFVLFGTRQQGVPVILRELVLPGGFDLGLDKHDIDHHPVINQL